MLNIQKDEKRINKRLMKFMNIWLVFLLYSFSIGGLFAYHNSVEYFKPLVIGGMIGLAFPLYIPYPLIDFLLN